MSGRTIREQLRATPIPGAEAAEERTWHVVARAYGDREPARGSNRVLPRGAVAVALAAAVLAGVILSSPGRAVVQSLRRAVGIERVEHSRSTLASLPTTNRLLVTAPSGAWVVSPSGALRRLGAYAEAAWSPRGLFVVATRGNELTALTPTGSVRWRLVRPARVTSPRWAESGFRIAYRQGATLRVVRGDGTGDSLLADGLPIGGAAPAWRPDTTRHVLAVVAAGGIVVLRDADSGRVVWRRGEGPAVHSLAWSRDGRYLLVLTPRRVDVIDGDGGRRIRTQRLPGRALALAAGDEAGAFAVAMTAPGAPGESRVAIYRAEVGARGGRVIFRGTGAFRTLVWADGRLIVTWPSADQWLFLPGVSRVGRVTALANIRRQLGTTGGAFPTVVGACCPRDLP
jgi:hypothetical protein